MTTIYSPSQTQTNSIQYCQSKSKRALDIMGALVSMVIYAPAFVLCLIVIKVVDNVPPFFRQERYGFRGEPFTIIKLRSMPIDECPRDVNSTRIQHKPNYVTTRTGKFLRRHSLDEIPQFWLVLKGEMSLVGHRAFPVYYVPHMAEMPGMNQAKIDAYLNAIRQYKPGMTALSAVNGRANLSLQQKIEYDMAYAEQANLWLDIKILLRSIVVVITCEGAR